MTLYDEKRQNSASFRALTGLNIDEFDVLLLFFADAWETRMEETTITGIYRWNRRYTSYRHSPLPTAADKLFFILVYVKQAPTQEVHGALFGLSQSNANKWIHALYPALYHALDVQGLIPAKNADEFRTLLQQRTDDPLFLSTTEQNDPFNDHPIPMNNLCSIVENVNVIPLKILL